VTDTPQHEIDPDDLPYDPAKLPRKKDIGRLDFFAVDMRTGVVTAVEPFAEARKPAWKIEVDFGPVVGRLRSSAQITNYAPGELLGRTVVGAINLGEKRIAGFTSQFLILGALEGDGTVRLLELPAGVPPGSVIA
jgi:tRNA-binding protein